MMPPTELTSKRYSLADAVEAIELYFDRGWTDGLLVVPPTEERIWAMLEKVAMNAVMAGCKPEYMPAIVAAIEGIGDPKWGHHGPGTSTAGAAVLMIVNGPIAQKLQINSGDNLFGPGWRANSTIGRAVRLVVRNVISSLPGRLDRATLGHPGKYTSVIVENEADSLWPPST